MFQFGLWLAGSRRHIDVVILVTHHERCATLSLCIEAAGRVEARRAENRGRRPILWQKSSEQPCPLVYIQTVRFVVSLFCRPIFPLVDVIYVSFWK